MSIDGGDLDMDTEDTDRQVPRRSRWRFVPIITFGNLISLGFFVIALAGMAWGIYASMLSKVEAVKDALDKERDARIQLESKLSLLGQRVTSDETTITEFRSDFKNFASEMRSRTEQIKDAVGTLTGAIQNSSRPGRN